MGTGKRGKKDMVTPSWGSFQKPNQDSFSEQQEQEFDQELPGKIADKEKPEGKKPQWGNFQSPSTYQGPEDPTSNENELEYFTRNAVSNSSRIAEQVAGRYGNIEKFAKDTLVNVPKTGGIIGWAISELLGPERWERIVRGPKDQEQILPTSQQLKKASQEISGGYTKSKTPGEEKFQSFTEDVGSTLTGRGTLRPGTPVQMTANHLLIPAAANVTKEIVKDLGFGEDKSNLAKMAVWIPLTLATNINAPQYASNLMNQGRNGFNPNLTASVPRYQNARDQVARNMLQGDPRSALAQQQLAGIQTDIANGQTSIRDLMTRYDAINAAKRDRGLFALNVGDRRAAIRNINQVRDAVRSEIEILGQANPQALQSWQNGVQAWATIHRSNSLTNWIEGIARGPYSKLLSGPAAALFGVGSYSSIKSPLIAGPLAGAVPAAYKTGQTIYRVLNDRNLANYYWESISAATQENLPSFLNNYYKLDKALEKSDSAKPKSKSKEK